MRAITFPAMQLGRLSGLPRLLIPLAMTAALLFPEVGHGFAHHHAAEHRMMRMAEDHYDDTHSASGHAVVAEDHEHSDHPHLELVASPATKPLLGYTAVVVRVASVVLSDLRHERPLTPVSPTGLSPGDWTHGPPPPSRAPPRV
jgi:hypothetical protein